MLSRRWRRTCQILRTSGKPRDATPSAYLRGVNGAIDYVVRHLDKPIRLADVARAASFSPFHFHRVFQTLVGMTLADFIKRRRLDKALSLMAHSRMSLTEIALACGFASSSDFSRSFKQTFHAPPSRFDVEGWRTEHRAELDATLPNGMRRLHLDRLPDLQDVGEFKVRLRELPARTVAYIRVANPYRGNAVMRAIERLVAWAERRGCADRQWLGYQWDNPEIVALKDCHYYAAVEVDEVIAKGEIGRYDFPRMLVAEIELRGGIYLELRALDWLYGTWLPRSHYVPDDQPGFEAWIGRPFAHGVEHFEINVQLPIRTRTIRR
jgi:AraC family transcriptional regulator